MSFKVKNATLYGNLNPSHHPGLTPTIRGHFENDKYVFFWSGPFSNWDMGDFVSTLGVSSSLSSIAPNKQ